MQSFYLNQQKQMLCHFQLKHERMVRHGSSMSSMKKHSGISLFMITKVNFIFEFTCGKNFIKASGVNFFTMNVLCS